MAGGQDTYVEEVVDERSVNEAGQWVARVGEPFRVELLAGQDELLDRVGDVPDVDIHPGQDPPSTEPERDELSCCGVTAEDNLVEAVGVGVARVLMPWSY